MIVEKNKRPESIEEIKVGISEYIGSHIGFRATIKQRYSDFIVNEIDNKGDIVSLNDCNFIPPNEKNQANVCGNYDDFVSKETEERLTQMENGSLTSDFTFELGVDDSKEKRKQIHQYVRQNFKRLETRTEDVSTNTAVAAATDDNPVKKRIIVCPKNKNPLANARNTSYDDKGLPKYLHFVLYKEGIDTIQAVSKMGRLLRVKTSRFSYAGTKDKRALTTQRMSVFKMEAARLRDINRLTGSTSVQTVKPADQSDGEDRVEMGKLSVGNFTYSDDPIRLGALRGNRFRLRMRDIAFPSPLAPCLPPLRCLDRCFDSLGTHGFVNYFGHQRFGSSLDTWRIGRSLLLGDWSGALDLILRPAQRATPELRYMLGVWERTRDPSATLASVGPDITVPELANMSGHYDRHVISSEPAVDTHASSDPVGEGKNLAPADPLITLPQTIPSTNDHHVTNASDASPTEDPSISNGSPSRPLNFYKLIDCAEYKLLLALARYGPSDPLKVMTTALHRNLRLMYVHSYQSYVWNHVASALLEFRRRAGSDHNGASSTPDPLQPTDLLPLPPIFDLQIGDLIRVARGSGVDETRYDCGHMSKKMRPDDISEPDGGSNGDTINPEGELDQGEDEESKHINVQYVTADNIANFSVSDLVLPLPGYDVLYPRSSDCLKLYQDVLGADGLKYDEMRRKVKDYSLPGDYRNFLARPQDLRWKVLDTNGSNQSQIKDIEVEFSLPPSCYATILLRELTKQSCLDMQNF